MQTQFTSEQLENPRIAEADSILRRCIHCGLCTAVCPTYVLLGDERDSPRGRIYLIKDMLEGSRPASARVQTHVDRCLSCLSCVTTCPSGVDYMHLIDMTRSYIEQTGKRSFKERFIRGLLARTRREKIGRSSAARMACTPYRNYAARRRVADVVLSGPSFRRSQIVRRAVRTRRE